MAAAVKNDSRAYHLCRKLSLKGLGWIVFRGFVHLDVYLALFRADLEKNHKIKIMILEVTLEII